MKLAEYYKELFLKMCIEKEYKIKLYSVTKIAQLYLLYKFNDKISSKNMFLLHI